MTISNLMGMLCWVLAASAESARASTDVGTAFSYQGQLKDGGIPASGLYDMRFSLYDAAESGVLVDGPLMFDGGPGHQASVVVTNGLFSVVLNFPGSFDGTALWLHVDVRPHGFESYTPLTPRQAITATPFALYALDGPGGTGPWTVSGADIRNTNAGNVGIGTESPAAPLHVVGDIRSDGQFGVAAHNPNNTGAVAALGWLNDVARIRIGGNGPGASNGLDIQKTGDRSLMRVHDNGDVWVRGMIDAGYDLVWGSDSVNFARARCADGYRVMGGGCTCGNLFQKGQVWSSNPADDGRGWECGCIDNESSNTVAYAICLRIK